jgi:WD40 repeat protein
VRRIRFQRRGLLPAVLITIVGVLVAYAFATWGWAALRDSQTGGSTEAGTLPLAVEQPPPSVASTGEYGPIGSVSMVFAGTHVRSGLFGELDPVWLAVSSRDGDYRALSASQLPEPGPGAVAVSPAGDRLAWAGEDGLEVYDTITGESEAISLAAPPTAVGQFSPDGSRLLVYAEALVVVDVDSGRTLSTFEAPAAAVRRTAWRPDGAAVDFVSGRELVTGKVPGDAFTSQPTEVPEAAQLEWSPDGNRLVSLREARGVKHLWVSPYAGGRLGAGRELSTPQISLERLVGFSGDSSIAVIAYALESGATERVLDIPLGGGTATDLTSLPEPGENWVGSETLAIATDTLAFGSTDFEEHIWPWSYPARLVACTVLGLFFLGLFVTRRPRHR